MYKNELLLFEIGWILTCALFVRLVCIELGNGVVELRDYNGGLISELYINDL